MVAYNAVATLELPGSWKPVTTGLQGMGPSAKRECQHTALGLVSHSPVPPFPDGLLELSLSWMAREVQAPLQVLRCILGPFSVLNAQIPRKHPNGCFFSRDARGQSGSGRWKEALDCTDTHGMERSQAMQGHQPAPVPLPRLESLSLLPSCLSAPSLKAHYRLEPCLQALR